MFPVDKYTLSQEVGLVLNSKKVCLDKFIFNYSSMTPNKDTMATKHAAYIFNVTAVQPRISILYLARKKHKTTSYSLLRYAKLGKNCYYCNQKFASAVSISVFRFRTTGLCVPSQIYTGNNALTWISWMYKHAGDYQLHLQQIPASLCSIIEGGTRKINNYFKVALYSFHYTTETCLEIIIIFLSLHAMPGNLGT